MARDTGIEFDTLRFGQRERVGFQALLDRVEQFYLLGSRQTFYLISQISHRLLTLARLPRPRKYCNRLSEPGIPFLYTTRGRASKIIHDQAVPAVPNVRDNVDSAFFKPVMRAGFCISDADQRHKRHGGLGRRSSRAA